MSPASRRPLARAGTEYASIKMQAISALAHEEDTMLGWVLTFFILAVIAGLLGFWGVAGAAAAIARILFVVFLVLLVVSALVRALRGRPPI